MKDYNKICPQITLKYKPGNIEKVKIKSSKDLDVFFRQIFDTDTIQLFEEVMAIFLNRANETLGWFKVSQGGITGTIVDIRMIMNAALRCHAESIVLAHNHPSGTLNPSNQDIEMTKRIKDACKFFDMNLLDHIIITAEGYYSFADSGRL